MMFQIIEKEKISNSLWFEIKINNYVSHIYYKMIWNDNFGSFKYITINEETYFINFFFYTSYLIKFKIVCHFFFYFLELFSFFTVITVYY